MKKTLALISALSMALGVAAAASPAVAAGAQQGKVLVAYYSRTDENYGGEVLKKGNTAIIAEMIAQKTSADLYQISVAEPYPFAYEETVDIARREQRDNARPALADALPDVSGYDTVFLGYPIWWSDMPMVVYTFLEGVDLAGKKVIPFCTHAGSGISRTPGFIAKVQPKSEVLEGLALYGTEAQHEIQKAESKVDAWLNTLGF